MHQAEEPLTKVTLNLFASDVEYLRVHPKDWSVEVRLAVRRFVNDKRRKAASLRPSPFLKDEFHG